MTKVGESVTIAIVKVLSSDDATPDDLLSASFSENDVARLHLLRELPRSKNVIRLSSVVRVDLKHPLPHFLLAGVHG